MENWKDTIQKAISQVPAAERRDPLVDTLQEFADLLDENPWIRARLHQSWHGSLHRLDVITGPELQRDLPAFMLSFTRTPAGISPLGREDVFSEPDALHRYLIEFATSPAFQQTIGRYRQLTEEPVQAWLRTDKIGSLRMTDVSVEVESADQARLVRAAAQQPGERLRLAVRELTPFGNFQGFDEAHPERYRVIESGGYALDELRYEGRQDGRLVFSGRVVPLRELEA